MKRGCGMLLHLSSLPSSFGVGDLGPGAYRFVDFLKHANIRYWQLLPLNPTDPVFGNSPYSSNSAFAANILFISPEELLSEGWLTSEEVANPPSFPTDKVEYEQVLAYKQKLFDLAFARLPEKKPKAFAEFIKTQALWLDDYADFLVLKRVLGGQPWNRWPDEIRRRDPVALKKINQEHHDEITKIKFLQFLFWSQFQALKHYCSKKGIDLIGDIPIYVGFDSVDVWANPLLFKLKDDFSPEFVAGVPPDYFSKTGQRWGNPVYDWDKIKTKEYAWWVSRIRHNLSFFDYIRIDHFRGFAGYWEIPAAEETAINGRWVDGPGEDFFNQLKMSFPALPLIAEDLGVITPDVTAMMKKFKFPGMKILLFAFNGDMKTHPYIPENYVKNCVAYSGTHDNNTVRGWFDHEATADEKKNLAQYIGKEVPAEQVSWTFVDVVMKSVADLAVIPIQDFLGLGAQARMNTPGKAFGNWSWRYPAALVDQKLAEKIRDIVSQTKR